MARGGAVGGARARMARGWVRSGLSLGLWLGLCAAPGRAGEGDAPPHFVETLVVTASKLARPEDQVTQKVDRIEAAELESRALPNRNLAELLGRQPGAAVAVLSRNDANWGAYGGLGPKYNTFLLDGLPVDSFVDTMSLDASAFEAVETQRGVASVLYTNYLSADFAGNQSPLAGTTNLVLRRHVDSPRTRLELTGGSYRTAGGRFYHQGRSGPLHYFAGAGQERSDYTDYGTEGSWLRMLDTPRYDKAKVYVGTTWVVRPGHEILFFVHHTGHDGYVGRPNRDYGNAYDTVNLDYRGTLRPSLEARLKLGYRGYERRWGEDNYNPPASTDLSLRAHDAVTQRILPLDASLAWRQRGDSLLTAGIDYQHAAYQTYSENDGRTIGNDATAANLGLYAQEELVVGRMTLRGGARLNQTRQAYARIAGGTPGQPEASWDKLLWSAGLRWRVSERLSLYANSGTSFVAPSAKSVGGTLRPEDEGLAGRHGQLPNPELRPESGRTGDLGGELHVGRGLRLGLRGFVTRLTDAILETRVSSDPSQSRSVNAGETRASGLEVEARGSATARVVWYANVTLATAEIADPLDGDQDGATVPFVPGRTVNGGVTVSLGRGAVVRGDVRHSGGLYDSTSLSGRRRLPAYSVVTLSGELPFVTRPGYVALLRGSVENLLDERYEMPWQFRDPGRRGTLSLILTFH